MNWLLLKNSLLVSGLVSLLAGALGFVAAIALAGAGPKWRRAFLLGAIAAATLPPFLVTNCWLDLLGPQSPLRRWFPLELHTIGGAVWLLALLTWPISTLLTVGAWTRLEPWQLEAEPALRGGALIRCLLWPMARGALGQAAMLTFVLALNNFSVPVILQVPVFPEELWLALTARLDETGAWAAAVPMVLVPLAALLALRREEIVWPRLQSRAAGSAVRRQLGPAVFGASVAIALLLLLLSLAVPLAQLTGRARTWLELPDLFRAAPGVMWNSFLFAAAAATATVAIGLGTWRLPLGTAVWVTFFLPGILLGRTMVALFHQSFLAGTAALVIGAFAVRYLAIGWHGAALALRSADRDLVDAARISGARGWMLLRHVYWPQIAPRVAAAWYVVYLLCLWDVETLVLLYPPGGETLALRVFNFLHYGHDAQVNALCLTLLALALAPLLLWKTARWIQARREPSPA